MNNKYYILRHGSTEYQDKNINLIYPSHGQIPLSKRGEKEAEFAAEKAAKEQIEIIYCSPFLRTKQTAEKVRQKTGAQLYIEHRLHDLDLGVYHGKKKDAFYAIYPHSKERFNTAPEGGESWNDLLKRMSDFIEEIDILYKNKKILIVSHADPLWLLEGKIKNKSEEELLKIRKSRRRFIKTGEFRKL